MNGSKQRKIGVILSYISVIVNTIIQLLYTPLLIKNLGQSEYGLFSLASSVIGYLTIMSLGFGNAIIVYTAKYRAQGKTDEEKKLHGMFNVIYKIISIIATLAGLILYFNVEVIFGNTMTNLEIEKMKIMMLILAFNLFLSFYFSIYNSIISAYEKFTFQKILSIIHSISKPLLMIPLLFLGFKSIALCIVITITNLLTLMSNCYYCEKVLKVKVKYNGFDKKLFKIIFGYSFWVFLQIIVDKINWSIDNFILGAVSGTIAVSIYSIASTLNLLFINLSTAVSGVLLPKMSKMIAKKTNSVELTKEFIKVGRIQYYIIFLVGSGLILFGKNFIMLWAGPEFEESYYVALLLVIPMCFPLIQNLGLSIMQAMNKFKFNSLSTFAMAIINVLISIFLARKYGAIGAAAGTTISIVICNILVMNIYYHKSLKLNMLKFWKEITIMTVSFLPPLIIMITIMTTLPLSGVKGFVIYGGLYTMMYCITAYLFVMNSYEKGIVDKAIKRKKLKKN